VKRWISALRPVRPMLIEPLSDVSHDPARGQVATDVLIQLAKDDPETLVRLILDAEPRSSAPLIEALKPYGPRARHALAAVMAESVLPRWDDPPLDPFWSHPDPALKKTFEEAGGMLGERFAFCQAITLDGFIAASGRLRASGYRPSRIRPYLDGRAVRIATIWVRDGRDWQLAHGLSAEQIRREDESWRSKAYYPADASSYLAPPGGKQIVLYAALWVKAASRSEESRMYVGVPEDQHKAAYQPLKDDGLVPGTHSVRLDPTGEKLHTSVWVKPQREPKYSDTIFSLEPNYEVSLLDEPLQVDVSISGCQPILRPPGTWQSQLARAEKTLRTVRDDLEALFLRAQAHVWLGSSEEAVKEYTALIEKEPKSVRHRQFRAFALASLGRSQDARKDVEELTKLGASRLVQFDTAAAVATLLGEDAGMVKLVEATVAENPTDHEFLHWAASNYGRASLAVAAKDVAKSRDYRKHAVELIEQAFSWGWAEYGNLLVNPYIEAVRDDPSIAAIIARGHPDRRYSAVWHADARFVSRDLHGLAPGWDCENSSDSRKNLNTYKTKTYAYTISQRNHYLGTLQTLDHESRNCYYFNELRQIKE